MDEKLFSCNQCDKTFLNCTLTIKHLLNDHQVKDGGKLKKCVFTECSQQYSWFGPMKRHIEKEHSAIFSSQSLPSAPFVPSFTNSPSNSIVSNDDLEQMHLNDDKNEELINEEIERQIIQKELKDFQIKMLMFSETLLSLNISETAINTIFNIVKELFSESHSIILTANKISTEYVEEVCALIRATFKSV